MYKDLDTVTNPPTTQGVIELTALFNNLMLRKFYCTVSTVLWYDLNFVLIFTGFFLVCFIRILFADSSLGYGYTAFFIFDILNITKCRDR